MDRLLQSISRQLDRARDVEGFVVRIVVGGLALITGLWFGTLTAIWSVPWLLGAALAVSGAVALGSGIWSEIEYR